MKKVNNFFKEMKKDAIRSTSLRALKFIERRSLSYIKNLEDNPNTDAKELAKAQIEHKKLTKIIQKMRKTAS